MTNLPRYIAAFIAGVTVALILNSFSPIRSQGTVSASGCMAVPATATPGDFRKYQQTCINCTPNYIVYICKGEGPNCNTDQYFFRSCGPRPGFEEIHK